jgi:hypothetical protein
MSQIAEALRRAGRPVETARLDGHFRASPTVEGRTAAADAKRMELQAMQTLAETLGRLAPEARERVLRWAVAILGRPGQRGSDERPPEDRREPTVSMLHDFVAEFQRLARDWQALVDDPLPPSPAAAQTTRVE